jgi:RNA polymerase sigma-70 factor (ECF subfamily)
MAQSPDAKVRRQAYGAIIDSYWKPVYKYLRLRRNLNNENAKDLTQGFFVLAIEKRFFDGYDPEKGTFRTYLITCVDAFVANQEKRSARLKRGGGATVLSLHFKTAEGEISSMTSRAIPVWRSFSIRSGFGACSLLP